MADIVGERVQAGQAIVDHDQKVFPDYEAEPGQKAYVFMHTVPFEGSVGIVNMLTATRLARKGFDLSMVLFGPASLMVSATVLAAFLTARVRPASRCRSCPASCR